MSGGFDKGFSISPLAGGGGGVPLNFSQTKGAQVTITAAEAKPATVVSTTITTQGNPVQIIVAGDANPSSAGSWGLLNIYRDGTAVGQLVQFESSAANENVPYCLQVVDEPAAGTWTYSLKVTSVTANTQFGEGAGPIITVTELGAEAGGGGGGTIAGTIAANEIAFGTGIDSIGGSAQLEWNAGTGVLTVSDAAVTPVLTVDTANAAVDLSVDELRLAGSPGAAGEVLTSNGPGVAPTWQAGGGGGGSIGGTIETNQIAYGTAANTVSGSGDFTYDGTTLAINSSGPSALTVASTFDGQFLDVNTSLYSITLTDPLTPTNSLTLGPSDVGLGDGSVSANMYAGEVSATDNGTTNKISISALGGEATLKADDSAGALVELHLSASSITMQSMVASGDFFAVDATTQRLTVVDPGTGVDSAYLEGGRVTVDAAGNTVSLDAFTVPTITTLNVGSSLPMPLNLAIEALQINSNPGSSGDVLVSAGAGSSPTWQAPTFGNFGSKVLLCVEGGSYATIQAAIDAAADWDIILVGPKAAGASWGPAVFSPGKRLVVASLGSKWSTQVRVDSITFNANSGLNILLNTVFVRGLFINSSFTAAAPGVNFYGSAPARLRLQECFIYNSNAATGTGVVSNNSGSGSSLYIDNCIVQSGASTGIGLDHQQGYTVIRNDSEISRYQYPLQCAAGTVEIIDSVLDGTGIANEVVRMTGGLVTCGYTTIKNTTTNATGANLVNAGAAFGMGDATFAIGTGTGYCVNGVAGSFYLYGNVTYSNSAAAAYNVKVKNTLTALAVTQAFTSSP